MTPQLENGYTMIANEILDALCKFRIPGEQRQCLDFVLRKTYGFKKSEDQISNGQFCVATGLTKGNVSRAIKWLSEKQLVIKNDNTKIPTYRFNKNYSEWLLLSKKQPVIKKATVVIKNDNKLLSKVMDTKEKKETIQKKKETTLSGCVAPDPVPVKKIVEILNTHCRSSFKASTQATVRHIKARWREGWRESDFEEVISFKVGQWLTDPKMSQYLRPETLFGNKFEGYLTAARAEKGGVTAQAIAESDSVADRMIAENRARMEKIKREKENASKV